MKNEKQYLNVNGRIWAKNSWRYGYSLKITCSKYSLTKSKKSLINAIEEIEDIKINIDAAENEDSSKYRSIVNFNTFLYYVFVFDR